MAIISFVHDAPVEALVLHALANYGRIEHARLVEIAESNHRSRDWMGALMYSAAIAELARREAL